MIRFTSRRMKMLAFVVGWSVLLPVTIAAAPAASGYYQTVQKDGVWWFQSPDGHRFFSRGVNVVDPGASKSAYNSRKPEYAAFRYYPTNEAWAEATLERLRTWNFNTIGGWSHPAVQSSPLPFTVVLNLGEAAGAPWGDLFSPEAADKFDAVAQRVIPPVRDNPQLLGYFTDNELGWWTDTIFLHFLKQPATNHTRQILIGLMRTYYGDQIEALQRDFTIGKAKTFDDLGLRGKLTMRPGGQGMKVVDEFLYLLAERYYKLAHDTIRRYDDHHLILGDRYAAWYSQSVVRAAGPYVDAISINTGADWSDGTFSPFLLNSLHAITGKPVLISEFYMCATENRSGNKNTDAIFPTVLTQAKRAQAFRTNLEEFARLPFVIGAHWFQYYDEPTFGRTDGEDYNMGLVDIHDRPYEKLTAEAASLDTDAVHSSAVPSKPNDTSVVPKLAAATSLWHQRFAMVGGSTATGPDQPFADLYATWDLKFLYLVLQTAGYIDPHLFPGAKLPLADSVDWTVNVGGANKPVRIRFEDKSAPVVQSGAASIQMRRHSTRFTLVLKIPASSLEAGELAEGGTVSLHSSLTGYGRLHTMQWTQRLQLASSQTSSANLDALHPQ